jgi:hypothetical protein
VEAAGIEPAQPEQGQEAPDGVSVVKTGASVETPPSPDNAEKAQAAPDRHTVTERIREALGYLEEGRIDLARLALNALLREEGS